MNKIYNAVLIIVGLINAIPLIGVLSATVLSNLYGMPPLDGDLLILMRHRAVLLGIVGVFLITSAFKPHLRFAAIVTGIASMGSFILLVLMAAEHGEQLHEVMLVDVVAIGALALVVLIQKPGQKIS